MDDGDSSAPPRDGSASPQSDVERDLDEYRSRGGADSNEEDAADDGASRIDGDGDDDDGSDDAAGFNALEMQDLQAQADAQRDAQEAADEVAVEAEDEVAVAHNTEHAAEPTEASPQALVAAAPADTAATATDSARKADSGTKASSASSPSQRASETKSSSAKASPSPSASASAGASKAKSPKSTGGAGNTVDPRNAPITAHSKRKQVTLADVLTLKAFIGGVPFTSTDAEFRDYFAQFGELSDAIVMREKSGRSRGFGFVVYREKDSLVKLMNSDLEFAGRRLQAIFAIPKDKPAGVRKVFVSDLTPACTTAVLREHFGTFGRLEDVRVVSDGTERHRGYGFVVYCTRADAHQSVSSH